MMHLDEIRTYCLAKPGAEEDMPFGDDALVFKVSGKMFALLNLARLPPGVNLKCDPERAIMLREEHEEIRPGYHMNKRHWNTVAVNGRLPRDMVQELIDHSYDLVVQGLPKKVQKRLFGKVV